MAITKKLLTFTALAAFAFPAFSEDAPKFDDHLLGDMGGLRNKLANDGIDFTVEYKGDFWRNSSGGAKQANAYNDNLDLKAAIDGEKAFGIQGNKALIYFINNFGTKPNAREVGSTQGVDNIEPGINTFKLYEAWMDQSFLDNKLSVLVGLHDLNSEFYLTDNSSNFIKPSFQIGQDFAQSGQNGPSIFPTTSLVS